MTLVAPLFLALGCGALEEESAPAPDVATGALSAATQKGTRPTQIILAPRCRATVPAPVRGAHGSAVPADYDGDGHFDIAVKQDDGDWSIDYAANGFGAWDETLHEFGPAYYVPVPGDYDGDGKADLATKDDHGAWYIDYASNGFGAWDQTVYGYGDGSATPVPADYDGDCKVDLAIKDSAGSWYIDYAADGFGGWNAVYPGYGGATSLPVPADYDGDSRADIAVKDTTTGHWIIDYAANGFGHWDVSYAGYGGAEFMPVPADYDGDGKADLASRDLWDAWYIDYAANGLGAWDVILYGYGSNANYQPAPADYDGDQKVDLVSHTDSGDWLVDYASDGFGVWNQNWNSYVTVSGRRDVTDDDVRKFDSKWMQAAQLGGEYVSGCGSLQSPVKRAGWDVAARTEGMLAMYEVTRQTRYLDEAIAFLDCALKGRDDNPDNPMFDEVRGVAGLAGWGGRGVDYANFYSVDETISNVLAHPFAAFARIVAEDPMLQGPYGDKAIKYADAVVQTIHVFLPQMKYETVNGTRESYLALDPKLRTVVNDDNCRTARDAALNALVAPSADQVAYINQLESNCENYWRGAGYPMAHNEESLFLLNLIEMSRVLDSDFYRASSPSSQNEESDRTLYPLLVSYGYNRFKRHLAIATDGSSAWYVWDHVDDVPGLKLRDDDASHALVSMRFITSLNRNLARLNARIATTGASAIALGTGDLQLFANTFIHMTASGHIADNVGGGPADPVGSTDGFCDGWLGLSGVDARVFDRCDEILLRLVDGSQPNLSVASHAALLAAKSLRYPALPKSPIPPRRTAALAQ